MYISKNKTIKQLFEEFKPEELRELLKEHSYIVVREVLNATYYAVYEVMKEGEEIAFPFRAYFNDLKSAIKHAEELENPTMINEGYQFVKLGGSLSLMTYYNEHESKLDTYIKDTGRASEEAYSIGDTGISVCMVNHDPKPEEKGEVAKAFELIPHEYKDHLAPAVGERLQILESRLEKKYSDKEAEKQDRTEYGKLLEIEGILQDQGIVY